MGHRPDPSRIARARSPGGWIRAWPPKGGCHANGDGGGGHGRGRPGGRQCGGRRRGARSNRRRTRRQRRKSLSEEGRHRQDRADHDDGLPPRQGPAEVPRRVGEADRDQDQDHRVRLHRDPGQDHGRRGGQERAVRHLQPPDVHAARRRRRRRHRPPRRLRGSREAVLRRHSQDASHRDVLQGQALYVLHGRRPDHPGPAQGPPRAAGGAARPSRPSSAGSPGAPTPGSSGSSWPPSSTARRARISTGSPSRRTSTGRRSTGPGSSATAGGRAGISPRGSSSSIAT